MFTAEEIMAVMAAIDEAIGPITEKKGIAFAKKSDPVRNEKGDTVYNKIVIQFSQGGVVPNKVE